MKKANDTSVSLVERVVTKAAHWLIPKIPMTTRRSRCLIVNRGAILLVYNRLNFENAWTLPGGGCHKNEPATLCAQREVKEELNISLKLERMKYLGAETYRSGRSTVHYELVAAAASSRDFTRNKLELVNAHWFPLTQLPKNRSEIVDDTIKKANFKS